jgi:aryl-alcohol dehydrogenase-like predicted oxidoreductase
VAPSSPVRARLPETRRSLTHKFAVGQHEGYFTVGFFEDGRPGEVFIKISKHGSTIGLLPWSPLASGFLTGKYEQGEKAPGDSRAASGGPMYDRIMGKFASKEQNWATLEVVREIAGSMGVTPSQVALSWVTNRPGVTAPILGPERANT